QQFVDQANSNVSRAESVRKFLILSEDFTQEDGTLTPSMKVIRPQVLKQYESVIDRVLYAPRVSQPRPQAASAKLMEKASESLTPLVSKAQENAMPRINEMLDSIDRARSNVSDSLANVSERIRSQAEQDSPDESTSSSEGEDAERPDGDQKDSGI
ncbi:MAG: long-chain fatty acid--CoA ligase, partial [Bifidobacterium sp.]